MANMQVGMNGVSTYIPVIMETIKNGKFTIPIQRQSSGIRFPCIA
jgi:hypothetical protein